MKVSFTAEIDIDGNEKLVEKLSLNDAENLEIEIEVEVDLEYTPGNLYGPPENCYPAEYETDFLSAKFNGKDILDDLSYKNIDDITEQAWEQNHE